MYEITHTHKSGLSTEVSAFNKASKRSESTKKKILANLEAAGADGLTPDEFLLIHGGIINTVRRRFTDLWKEGKIQHHPTLLARKNLSGNECVAWVIGRDMNLSPSKAKRTWVGLTKEERENVLDSVPPNNMGGEYYNKEITEIAFAIEAKLKEKNT